MNEWMNGWMNEWITCASLSLLTMNVTTRKLLHCILIIKSINKSKCPVSESKCPVSESKCPVSESKCPVSESKCPVSESNLYGNRTQSEV